MKTRQFAQLVILGTLSLPAPAIYAADADEKPGTSVFDKHPECMEPDNAAAAGPKCVIDNGPPRRHVVGADAAEGTAGTAAAAAAVTEGGGIIVQAPGVKAGGQASAGAGGQGTGMAR